MNLAIFNDKAVRREWHNDEWWFSIIDAVEVLTDSPRSRTYWTDLKRRLSEDEGFSELHSKCVQLKLESSDGKKYKTDCANTETLLRIVQSIPSPKAEPFKRWLAQVGYERIQEIENPELASQRARALYQAKGYDSEWIEKRMRSIAIREELTDEWKSRGVSEHKEYAILTAEISKATFGMTPAEYKQHKALNHENLRDHMTDLELIFSMLGEASTTEIAKNTDAQGFSENKDAAQSGGKIAGDARLALEQKSGSLVIRKKKHLPSK